MQIELSKIAASPRPVRTSWDEAKMEELVASIVVRGVISPIKVRPIEDEYEIVYGHRRAEAARRVGLSQIPAIIDELDDSHAIMQAIIENLQREDLGPLDTAKAIQTLKEVSGLNNERVAKMLGMSSGRVSQSLLLLQEPPTIQEMLATKIVPPLHTNICDQPIPSAKITAKHVALVRQSGLDEDQRIQVLKKAATEELTAKQARQVADNLKETQSFKARERILAEPIIPSAPVLAEAIKMLVDADEEEEKEWWRHQAGEGAKNLLRFLQVTRETCKKRWLIVERGAIGPEHMPYLEKRFRSLGEYFIYRANELAARRKAVIGE